MSEYRASAQLRAVRAGSALVVVDARTGAAHVLDEQGAQLMDHLTDWQSPAAVASRYLPESAAPTELALVAEAIEATLEELTTIRLVDRR